MNNRTHQRPRSLLVFAALATSLLVAAGCDANDPSTPVVVETAEPIVVETPATIEAGPGEVTTAPAPAPAEAEAEPAPVADAASPAAEPQTAPPAPKTPVKRPAARKAPADRATETFTKILADVVDERGLVRYDQLKQGEYALKLSTVIDDFARAAKPDDPRKRMALWCNAYNANVLALVLIERRKPGFVNVVKVPGFFDKSRITVTGESTTLNDLENKMIRPLGDARIHAALVCAAMSCPPLRNEAYVADRLDEQFDDQCQTWVNDQEKFRIENGTLGLSQILKWYGDDFKKPPYSTPTGFVLAYADTSGAIASYIVNEDSPRITWLEYDWTLNLSPGTKAPEAKDARGG